jgi:hypothetical protein
VFFSPVKNGPLGHYPSSIAHSSVYSDEASDNPRSMLRPSVYKVPYSIILRAEQRLADCSA